MATFTITTTTNFDSLTGASSATTPDTYNINGGKLVVDTDTRYCSNRTADNGTLGIMNISSTLGGEIHIDGTKVRLIPYNTGTGTVPAIGTTITQGGVTSTLLGVWSALNVAPTAVGAAMPATGFIKVKNKSGGNYAAGALSGISASATGADVVGWIEVVAPETQTATVPRLGVFRITGEWYDVGTTSGTANQTFQLPASLANTYYPGVFIEKTAGSADYEFYANAGSQTAVATDIRAKVVWISSQGLLRIGHNGTANAGYTPPSGRKIVIPNVVTINTTFGTTGSRTNTLPNTTLASRFDFTTTGGGVITIDKANLAWYPSFAQAFSVQISNTGILEQISVSEIASEMTWSKVGVGQTAAQSQFALVMSLCFAGGTFTDCHFSRATLASSGQYTTSITDINGFVFNSEAYTALTVKGNATTGNTVATRVNNCTWNSVKLTNGRMIFATCSNITINGVSYADVITGTTATTAAQNSYVFEISSNTSGFYARNVDFFGLTNVHPYLGLLSIAAAGCNNVSLTEIGTRAVPLSLGSANAGAYIFALATGAAANNINIKRVYCSNTRTSIWTGDNSSTNITLENVYGDYADTPTTPMLNCQMKGIGGTISLTAQTSCYGTHWFDCFTSATVGRVGIMCNEKTSRPISNSSYTILSGTPKFTSAGGLFMPTIGDSVEFETPYYILGHTSFQNLAATMAGGTIGNYTLQYQIDTGSGYGTLKTLSGANLSAESISPATGFRLKIRITTSTTNTTAITSLYVTTNSTAVAQDNLYPLQTVAASLNLTGLVVGSEVRVYRTSDDLELAGIESTTGSTFTYNYTWTGTDTNVYIVVFAMDRQPIVYTGQVLGSTGLSIPVLQVLDRVYSNI